MSSFRKAKSLEDAKNIIEKIIKKRNPVLLWQQANNEGKKLQTDAMLRDVKIISKKLYIELYCESEIISKFNNAEQIFLAELGDQLVLLKGGLLKISRFTYHMEISHPTLLREFRADKRLDLVDKKLQIELTLQNDNPNKIKIDIAQIQDLSVGGIGILVPSGVSTKYKIESDVLINSINSNELKPALRASIVYSKVSKHSNALGGSLIHVGLKLVDKLEVTQMAEILVSQE